MEKLGKLLDEHIDWEKEQGAGAGKGKDKDKKGPNNHLLIKAEMDKIRDEIKESMIQSVPSGR